jgi:hypothetical protein
MTTPTIDPVILVSQYPRLRFGVNFHDDIKPFVDSPEIMQARNFLNGGSHPKAYYSVVGKTLSAKFGTVEEQTSRVLLTAIEAKYVKLVQDEFDASNQERKTGNTHAVKPVELFRKYSHDLRRIWEGNGTAAITAHGLFTDLYTESTVGEAALNSPDYLDCYTGEPVIETLVDLEKAIPDKHEPGIEELIKFISIAPDPETDETNQAHVPALSNSQHEVIAWANHCRQTLGWDEETARRFIAAQGSFDDESDAEPEGYDDIDPYTPPTMLPKDTLTLNRELWYSVNREIGEFNRQRSKVFKEMGGMTIKKGQWHATFRTMFDNTEPFACMLDAIERVAEEDVVTAAAIYVRMAGDYGLMEDDIAYMQGMLPNASEGRVMVSLLNFAREWEEDLLEVVQDSLEKGFPMSEKQIAQYDILENGDFRSSMPEFDPNPVKTAAWNIGFARAMCAGGTREQSEEAGWANWREEMDPKAAVEYNAVFAKTNNRKAAMAAFWRTCDRRVPRPQAKIKSIAGNKKGLVLENGRTIDWHVVEMKIKGNELFLGDDIKQRLLARLQQLNCGRSVWALLQ